MGFSRFKNCTNGTKSRIASHSDDDDDDDELFWWYG